MHVTYHEVTRGVCFSADYCCCSFEFISGASGSNPIITLRAPTKSQDEWRMEYQYVASQVLLLQPTDFIKVESDAVGTKQ